MIQQKAEQKIRPLRNMRSGRFMFLVRKRAERRIAAPLEKKAYLRTEIASLIFFS